MKYTLLLLTIMSMICNAMDPNPLESKIDAPAALEKPLLGALSTLSLLDAIMFGTIKACEGQLEYCDFQKPDIKYQSPINTLPQIIYTVLSKACEKTSDPRGNITTQLMGALTEKLIANPSALITPEEILPRQYIRFGEFLNNMDLMHQKNTYTQKYSKYPERHEILKKIDEKIIAIIIHRSLLKAALATGNEENINNAAKSPLHLEHDWSIDHLLLKPHIKDIKQERERCQHIHDNPLTHDCVPQ